MSEKKGAFDIKKVNEGITKYAPEISFWVAAVLILAGEIRVLDVVYKLTDSWFLALSALGVSGVMFFVWKNNWQYPIATSLQTNISLVGMIVSLGIAVWIGGLDYYVRAGVLPSNLDANATVINSLIYGTVGNIVALLLYWYKDPRIESIRAKVNNDEEFKWLEESTDRANRMLDKVTPLMEKYRDMVKRYGKRAADDMLIKAGIDPETFKNIIEALEDKTGKDINGDGRVGKQVQYAYPAAAMPDMRPPAQNQQEGTNHTLADLSRVSGVPVAEIKGMFTDYASFSAWCSRQFDHVSGGNMKRIWHGELGNANPQKGGQSR